MASLERDGELPIATFGGLKARGNPGGATGVYQAVEGSPPAARSGGCEPGQRCPAGAHPVPGRSGIIGSHTCIGGSMKVGLVLIIAERKELGRAFSFRHLSTMQGQKKAT